MLKFLLLSTVLNLEIGPVQLMIVKLTITLKEMLVINVMLLNLKVILLANKTKMKKNKKNKLLNKEKETGNVKNVTS